MNRSLLDVKGSALVVSQFTLYGDARGQRRPSFVSAAAAGNKPKLSTKNSAKRFASWVSTSPREFFQAMMSVELVNEGPGHNPPRLRKKTF